MKSFPHNSQFKKFFHSEKVLLSRSLLLIPHQIKSINNFCIVILSCEFLFWENNFFIDCVVNFDETGKFTVNRIITIEF